MRFPALLIPLAASLAAPLAAESHGWGDELPAPPDRMMLVAPRQLEPLDWPAPPLSTPPRNVRAIYLNAWVFGSRRFFDLVRLADTTEINAFVIDVKDDTGYLTYPSSAATAVQVGANHQLRATDFRKRLRLLHAHGIHAIARIVVAKDPLLAGKKPGWSIQHQAGGPWQDRRGVRWVDAFSDSVWIYAAQLGAEAIRLGFAELQFDYVRFPDETRERLATAVFPGRRGNESSRSGIARNLRLLGDRVRPLGVPFTIDVFGMTSSATADLGIGQVWEDLVTVADVVLPMVYPSHYYGGFYDMSHPNSEPYAVVKRAMQDGLRRTRGLGRTAEIRPWLQAFTLGLPRYTPFLVREQIRAVEDVGLRSWILWNAAGRYDPAIFRTPARALAARTAEQPSLQ